ncbi:MAG: hypothetical protein FWD31_00395 [Planctomycetaceae bacterium]|nr:hypothetical protein [Planctomycetaceae bacterium]
MNTKSSSVVTRAEPVKHDASWVYAKKYGLSASATTFGGKFDDKGKLSDYADFNSTKLRFCPMNIDETSKKGFLISENGSN